MKLWPTAPPLLWAGLWGSIQSTPMTTSICRSPPTTAYPPPSGWDAYGGWKSCWGWSADWQLPCRLRRWNLMMWSNPGAPTCRMPCRYGLVRNLVATLGRSSETWNGYGGGLEGGGGLGFGGGGTGQA